MSRTTAISTHESDGEGRLVQQYKNSPNIKAILSSFLEQAQLSEDAVQELYSRLDIDASEGIQLDNIGGIVDIERQGYSDEVYRILIKGKIATNVSEGTPEDIIQVFSILTSSTSAFLQELFPAQIAIMSNGLIISGLETLTQIMTENSTAAGVGVDFIGFYNGEDAFSFDGGAGLGFGDTTDANIGGEFAKVY